MEAEHAIKRLPDLVSACSFALKRAYYSDSTDKGASSDYQQWRTLGKMSLGQMFELMHQFTR